VDRGRLPVLVRVQPAAEKSPDVNDCAGAIRRIIAAQGPISLADFMRVALTDPASGYYVRRDPISGDFITAPEISQIFGELIGLFFVQAWQDRGRPSRFHLVELGPGRGTLMADLLRAARVRPEFVDAATIHLVEISPRLRAMQQRALLAVDPVWHGELSEIAVDAPVFIVANEFFDALPVRQFIHAGGVWHERKIGLDGDRFSFFTDASPAPETLIPRDLREAPEGSIFEVSDDAHALAEQIANRIVETRGVALIIDYGHIRSGFADTFQAVKAHSFADPLTTAGEADLTCHVDFAALRAAALFRGATVSGPATQAQFLMKLGIRQRAEMLKRGRMEYAAIIDSGVERLVSDSQMGTLFKVIGLSSPGSPPLPGFA
jgi:NADH dehydrogenase [ubiquinone] 1 alpha subcomplex assembly factor 7